MSASVNPKWFERYMLPKQLEAFHGAINNRIYLITGPGGTGKTYVIDRLVEYFKHHELNVTLAAPTGKAAKRMEQMAQHSASTLHRLLGYNGHTFTRNASCPISTDVLIVDEVSMLDVNVCYHLFKAIDFSKTRLILAGDHNQLPPVGPGNILRDILRNNLIAHTVLDQIVRQSGALRRNCLSILQGNVIGLRQSDEKSSDWSVVHSYDSPEDILNYLIHLFENVLWDKLGFHLIRGVQVLSPQYRSVLGVQSLNIAIQEVVQRKLFKRHIPPVPSGRRPRLYPGDKVIQTRNNYDLNIMNGHIGLVEQVDERTGECVIDFEDAGKLELNKEQLRDILLAHAVSIHRSQGSEFPCVITIIHSSHRFMLHRNLFYTGVSRAQKKAIILGDTKGIRYCANEQQLFKRRTFLSLAGVKS